MEISIDLTEEQERRVVHTHLWRSLHDHRSEYYELLDTSRIDAMECEDTKESLLKKSKKRRKKLKKIIKAHRILLREIKEHEIELN